MIYVEYFFISIYNFMQILLCYFFPFEIVIILNILPLENLRIIFFRNLILIRILNICDYDLMIYNLQSTSSGVRKSRSSPSKRVCKHLRNTLTRNI